MSYFPVVVGNVAAGAADSGNPVKVGAKAETSLAGITAVDDGDRADLYCDSDGVLVIKPFTTFGDIKNNTQTITSSTASTAVTNFGSVSGTRNYITTIAVYNSSATDTFINVQDGSGGTTLFVIPAPQAGGSVITFPVPLRQPTAATGLYVACNASVASIYLSMVGFQSKL